MTGLLPRVAAEDHRALRAHDLTGLHPWGGTRAMVGTNPPAPGDAVDSAGARATDAAASVAGAISPFGGPKGYALGLMTEVLVATLTRTALADAVPVSQVTWTSAQHITADVPERHGHA
ncbi:Ldh family oxidoreductase [Nonomuraea sp. NPDC050691]|uniref:Ldh family oxidoreductase n=1 Tax=Nonomuraea sp. NPDC050691 TaxID=3155661 RepID=UPI0033D284A3